MNDDIERSRWLIHSHSNQQFLQGTQRQFTGKLDHVSRRLTPRARRRRCWWIVMIVVGFVLLIGVEILKAQG